MAEVTKEAKAFFSDLRQDIEWWSKHHSKIPFSGELNESNVMHANMIEALRVGMAKKNLTAHDFEQYLKYVLGGLVHSILVDIDGGSTSADNGRQFRLVDNDGNDICPALHEYFVFESHDKS
jgi:hypothetical protein